MTASACRQRLRQRVSTSGGGKRKTRCFYLFSSICRGAKQGVGEVTDGGADPARKGQKNVALHCLTEGRRQLGSP